MTVDGQYNNSFHFSNAREAATFSDSQEAAFRRVTRQEIRRGPFTKSEREVVLAFFNHWFHHRKSPKGVVHPGRKKLARRAKVSIATVKRTLALLRSHHVIEATAHLEGLHGNATEYTVCTVALSILCQKKKGNIRVDGGSNCPTVGRVKMTHRISNVSHYPIQDWDMTNVALFPAREGA